MPLSIEAKGEKMGYNEAVATELWIGKGQSVSFNIWYGMLPHDFCWASAMPNYPHEAVELINQDNWMDENGTIHHNVTVKNVGPDSAKATVNIFKAYP